MSRSSPDAIATPHPCRRCGACCASFVVAFHWSETSIEATAPVPVALAEPLDAHRLAMRGTFARAPRCIALRGDVGAANACAVYEHRPSPCRELQPAWEHGVPSPQCDRARARHGLAALQPDDWTRAADDVGHIDAALPDDTANTSAQPRLSLPGPPHART